MCQRQSLHTERFVLTCHSMVKLQWITTATRFGGCNFVTDTDLGLGRKTAIYELLS